MKSFYGFFDFADEIMRLRDVHKLKEIKGASKVLVTILNTSSNPILNVFSWS